MRLGFVFLIWALTFGSVDIHSQEIRFDGISIAYDMDFSDWVLIQVEEDENYEVGRIYNRWISTDKQDDWVYSLGEVYGRIRKKFNNSETWEVDGPNQLVTMTPVFGTDKRSWRVTNNSISLTFETKWGNRADEWITRTDRFGVFYMHTVWENDPRDWAIIDDLKEEVPREFKIAMIFLATFLTSPKI